MENVFNLVIPIFGLILLGYFAAKTTEHHSRGLEWLSTFVIYFALPALFFKLLSATPFDKLTNVSFIFATTLVTFIIFSLTVVLSVVIARAPLGEAGVRGAAAAYGNVGYMGPALAISALGVEAAVPATLIICFDNLIFFAMVPLLVALEQKGNNSFLKTTKEISQKIFLHPFILASIAGVAAAYFQVATPKPIQTLIDYLSSAAAPCALFALGVTIAAQTLKRIPREMPFILVAKLIIQPVLAYFIVLTIAEPEPVWLMTAVLLASLPQAANVYILASQYGVYVDRASSTILIGTVCSVVTVSILLFLIEGKFLF